MAEYDIEGRLDVVRECAHQLPLQYGGFFQALQAFFFTFHLAREVAVTDGNAEDERHPQ